MGRSMDTGRSGEGFGVLGIILLIVTWAIFAQEADFLLRKTLWSFARVQMEIWQMIMGMGGEAWAIEESAIPDWHSLWPQLMDCSAPFGGISAFVIAMFCVVSRRLSLRERFCKTHTMRSLLAIHLKKCPCLAPILHWPRSLLEEEVDSGPWMCARQPLQFAAEHGLLLDKANGEPVAMHTLLQKGHLADRKSVWHGGDRLILDREKTRSLFAAQLGPKFQGFEKLSPYLYALAVSFVLFGLDRKGLARKITDQLSLSFRPATPQRSFGLSLKAPFLNLPKKARNCRLSASIPLKAAEVETLWREPTVATIIRQHNQYTHLLLYGLFVFARRRGILTCAEMIWLKPVNRPLFYLLNNYGRRTAWVEAAGALAHYRVEEGLGAKMAEFEARSLERPYVDEAVAGLSQALFQEGWIGEA